MLFNCLYVMEGHIEKQIYREGKNALTVKDDLDGFLWADLPEGGEWVITPAVDDDFGEREGTI